MTRTHLASVIGLLAMAGCGPSAGERPVEMPPDESFFRGDGLSERVDGPIVEHSRSLPSISGGTLTALQVNSGLAVAADPDRDRLLVVDAAARRIVRTIALETGAEPGRVIETPSGDVFVVLRGANAVARLDPTGDAPATIISVCNTPRGIAWDRDASQVRVICRDGALHSIDPSSNTVVAREQLPLDDARDLAFDGSAMLISTFRDAKLHRFVAGREASVVAPETGTVDTFTSFGGSGTASLVPHVAYRMAVAPDGTAILTHQRETTASLDTTAGVAAYYGSGSSNCSTSVVESAVTVVRGTAVRTVALADATLPVDVALAPDGSEFTVVAAGAQREDGIGVVRVDMEAVGVEYGNCLTAYGSGATRSTGTSNAVAAAYTPDGSLLVQLREPSALVFEDGERLLLGGDSVFDTGHAIFHGDAGRGTACASCHPEGGDDGHVWTFADPNLGDLRTPTMHGGFLATAPFHWRGDLPTISSLMNLVFEGRMGGPILSLSQEAALGGWIDRLPEPVAQNDIDEASASRGAALFWGAAECGTCHTGALYTDNRSVDVGTGGAFQVPSLLGVASRLPVMHDGCAATLEARLVDPRCGGGDSHGHTSNLGAADVRDLTEYLRTL